MQISKCVRQDEFSLQSCMFATISFILSLPSFIAGLIGIEIATGGADDMVGEALGTMESALGDVAGQALDLSAGMSDAFSNLAWISNPLPRHHKAAVRIQRFRKKRQMLVRQQEHRAAARIQAAARGKLLRSDYTRTVEGLPSPMKAVALEARGASRARAVSAAWVDKQVRRDLVQERLARARGISSRSGSALRQTKSFVRRAAPTYDPRLDRVRLGSDKVRPGVARLRDVAIEGVGIVYTRARPAGRETAEELRASALRLKRRLARKELPNELPPMPATVSGGGLDFAEVVKRAQRKHNEEELLEGQHGSAGASGSGIASGALAATSDLAMEAGRRISRSLDGGARMLGLGKARVGIDEFARVPLERAGEGAPLMAEQLGLHEICGNSPAIHGHQPVFVAR